MKRGWPFFFLFWAVLLLLSALGMLFQGSPPREAGAVAVVGFLGLLIAAIARVVVRRRELRILQAQAAGHLPFEAAPRKKSLIRCMAVHLLTGSAVWIAMATLVSVAGVAWLHEKQYALTTGLLRFGSLFWRSIVVFVTAQLVLWLIHFRWADNHLWPGRVSKWIAIAFGAVPVILVFLPATLVLLSGFSVLRPVDPWDCLPGGPPFALREFTRRHPQLHIEAVGILGGPTVALTNGISPRVIYPIGDLVQSDMVWEQCSDVGDPAQLGGPPPFPGSRCLARIQLLRPDHDALSDEQQNRGVAPPRFRTVRYVYGTGSAGIGEVVEHFVSWAKSTGSQPNLYSDPRRGLDVTTRGKTWSIEVRGAKYTVDDIYVEYTESHARAR